MNDRSTFQVVRLTGELDVGAKMGLREKLAIEPTARAILLDLTEVIYADSTALTELLRFKLRADEENVPVAIVTALPQFNRLIRYAGLDEIFKVFEDRGQALSYLESTS